MEGIRIHDTELFPETCLETFKHLFNVKQSLSFFIFYSTNGGILYRFGYWL